MSRRRVARRLQPQGRMDSRADDYPIHLVPVSPRDWAVRDEAARGYRAVFRERSSALRAAARMARAQARKLVVHDESGAANLTLDYTCMR